MSKSPFIITRADGRSNQQVVLDLVKTGEPGRVYTYEELGDALAVGSHTYEVPAIRSIVLQASPRLRREHQRALHNVARLGYRIAPAAEHRQLAHQRKRRADMQLKTGLDILRHVRWDEMTPNDRRAHEGHLMITEAICANQIALERRLRQVEDAIQNLYTQPPPAAA